MLEVVQGRAVSGDTEIPEVPRQLSAKALSIARLPVCAGSAGTSARSG